MKHKTLFIFLYGIVLAGAIATLSNLIGVLVSQNNVSQNNVRVAILATILICIFLFLVLFNYEPSRTPRQLELALIKRIRDSWLQALCELEKSFHRSVPPTFTLTFNKPELAEHHENVPVNIEEAVTKLCQTFQHTPWSLLITGGSGRGKTTILLRLAQVLIERADDDPSEPIPVILNLSSLKQTSLEKWIVQELRAQYDVSEEIGRGWLLQERLILLLDGLEKDDRADKRNSTVDERISALQDFVKRKATTGLVVSGNDVTGLDIQTKAMLRITGPQESKYIKNGETFASPEAFVTKQLNKAEKLGLAYEGDSLRRRLRWLAEVSQSNGRSQFTISQIQPSWLSSTTLTRLYLVLSRIAGAAVVMVIGTGFLFLSQTILRWVSQNSTLRIAGLFQIEKDLVCWLPITVFIGGLIIAGLDYHVSKDSPDDLQTEPDLILNLKHLALYFGTCAITFFIFSWFCINRKVLFSVDNTDIQFRNPILGSLAFGTAYGLAYWFRSRHRSLASDTNIANKLAWSPTHLLSGLFRWGLPGGWIAGLILSWSLNPIPNIWVVAIMFFLGTVLGFLSIVFWRIAKLKLVQPDSREGLRVDRILNASLFSLILWLGMILGSGSLIVIRIQNGPHPGFHYLVLLCSIGGMIGAIASGLRRVKMVETTSSIQDINLALRSTFLIWLSVSTPTILLSWLYGALIMEKHTQALGSGLFFGLVVGLIFGFAYAGFDVVYRFVFRSILWINGSAPFLNWISFLDNAVNLGFLRKIGKAYVFDQIALRNFFADLKEYQFLNERVAAIFPWRRQSDAYASASGSTATQVQSSASNKD